MPKLYLICTDRKQGRGDWLLDLREKKVVLVDPYDEVRAEFPRDEAERRFVLPSFWESVKNLGVHDDDGQVVWFRPERASIAAIKQYLERAVARKGPEAIRSLRRTGWLQIVGGFVLFVVCTAITLITAIQAYSNPQGGTYFVLSVPALLGLALVARGVSNLFRAGRAKRYLEEEGA